LASVERFFEELLSHPTSPAAAAPLDPAWDLLAACGD